MVGQNEVRDKFKVFLEKKIIPPSIFYGPSGVGKTTFARILAKELNTIFYEFDGASFSVEEMRKIIKKDGIFKPLVFIDEIHRLNKGVQDVLLKPLEEDNFYFIAASTHNPIYSLNKALCSRLLFFEFKSLNNDELGQILDNLNPNIEKDAREYLIKSSANDARAMLNLYKYASVFGKITLENLKSLRKSYISNKDDEYLLTSAFIKSLRASDTNAAILYLARMINSGVDILYIARRLCIFASEDVGNANPNALVVANATLQICKEIGLPEARIPLSQCVVMLSNSKKSNSSYLAINNALDFVKNNEALEIPNYLNNNHPDKDKFYIYPHDEPHKKQIMAPNCPEFYSDFSIGYEKNFSLWRKEGLYKC
ncbi:AAA family ATPase [Campylobacter sp. MG1]|uniref:AAA family ATPase n=1 Tax=Campylobacter sp. MG1 TaxID=2976332 RepID=UPI00226D12B7|nr:AAA family ATPase [Campylobacter sp. MG1]